MRRSDDSPYPEPPPDAEGRSEQHFFDDPALDRLMGVVFSLITEVQVLRDRFAVVEHFLDANGVVGREDIDGFEPDAEDAERFARDRREFVRHVLEPLRAPQMSKSEETL